MASDGPSRRGALKAIGVGGAAVTAAPLLTTTANAATTANPATTLLYSRGTGAVPVEGLHLTFGADPTSQMTVSWITETSVNHPRVLYGTIEGGFGRQVMAETRTYLDGTSSREVYVHHAALTGLHPDSAYVYAAMHDGAQPDAGTFRTAPRGRSPFTFTSFGDQCVPTLDWQAGTGGTNAGGYGIVPDSLATAAAADTVTGVEKIGPLFHLLNGDLCYANLANDRLRTWRAFFTNNSRSARFRPWMPAAGNHEDEKGNGPIGYLGYQTYFSLPGSGAQAEFQGLWYAFTVGSVRVVVTQNDDVALQDGGDNYVHGYSGGAQLKWLEGELAAARASKEIDWIVVCMHQVVISSADFNGADLGIRQTFAPLFDKYGVDLVVCGHEHDYERSLAVRGVVSGSETLTPNPVSDATTDIDTSKGTVHMVLGGGGQSSTSNQDFYPAGQAKVITSVGPVGSNGKRPSVFTMEETPWLGVRDEEHPYGFAAFTVDPGTKPGGTTRIHVTYYNVTVPTGELAVLENFTLQRRRSDG